MSLKQGYWKSSHCNARRQNTTLVILWVAWHVLRGWNDTVHKNLFCSLLDRMSCSCRVKLILRADPDNVYWYESEFWKHIPPSEPFRVLLGDMRDKLYNTRERMRLLLQNGKSDIPIEDTYTDASQVCYSSFACLHMSLASCNPKLAPGNLSQQNLATILHICTRWPLGVVCFVCLRIGSCRLLVMNNVIFLYH